MKWLIVYFFVGYMGFVMFGILIFSVIGFNVVFIGMVVYGLIIGLFFFLVGFMFYCYYMRDMCVFGG